jgi:hypothetical protein
MSDCVLEFWWSIEHPGVSETLMMMDQIYASGDFLMIERGVAAEIELVREVCTGRERATIENLPRSM